MTKRSIAVEFRNPMRFRFNEEGRSALIPLALLGVGVPWGILSVLVLLGSGGSQTAAFDTAAGSFVLLAMVFLGLYGLRDMAWVSVPTLLTIEALVGFVGIPVWRFAAGDDVLDAHYTHAMYLVLIGFVAFWIGSLLLKKGTGLQFVPQKGGTSARLQLISLAMLGLGLVGNLVLWKAGLFSYTADAGLRSSAAEIMQWLNFVANLMKAALLVSAIEVLGKRSKNQLITLIFWLSLFLSIAFGVISGMKSGPLVPLIYVIAIYSIINNRVPRWAFFLPVVLVLFIYPFVTAYRDNLNSGYRSQVNTAGGLEDVVVKSFEDAFFSSGSKNTGNEAGYSQSATSRLSRLNDVRTIISLPAPSMLNGDEKIWLAPIYPLIPRFLWKDKPVFDKGVRLSIVLGSGDKTSSASTPIGDLYAQYGTFGVAAGMLVWGMCLQLWMNLIGHRGMSEKGLFVYMLVLPSLVDFEADFIALVGGMVQGIIVAGLMSYVIYGPPPSSPPTARSPRPVGLA